MIADAEPLSWAGSNTYGFFLPIGLFGGGSAEKTL